MSIHPDLPCNTARGARLFPADRRGGAREYFPGRRGLTGQGHGSGKVKDDEPDPGARTARFAALALPHLDAAYGLARWLTRNDADAQDVVQDAYLRAFRAFDGLRGDDIRPWLLAIVRNTSLSWLAQRRGAAQQLPYDDDDPQHAAVAAALDSAAAGDPEALAMRLQDGARIDAALSALPAIFREVIVLRELQECSYVEISQVLGIPAGTVMSRLARARARLAHLLLAPASGDRT